MSVTEHAKNDMAAITGIDLAGYLVRDPERAVAFYRDVLGMSPTGIDDQGRGAEFTLSDGSTFGVWKAEEGQEPAAAIMFAVGDVNAAIARARERGATVSEPMESEVCFMAFGNDPEGNGFIIHQRKVRD